MKVSTHLILPHYLTPRRLTDSRTVKAYKKYTYVPPLSMIIPQQLPIRVEQQAVMAGAAGHLQFVCGHIIAFERRVINAIVWFTKPSVHFVYNFDGILPNEKLNADT